MPVTERAQIANDASCQACAKGQYESAKSPHTLPCVPKSISTCPPGQGYEPGSTIADDAQCNECDVDNWSAENDDKPCTPWSVTTCPSGQGMDKTLNGALKSDAVCGACDSGRFSASNDDGRCLEYTDVSCDAGSGAKPGTAFTDATCVPCVLNEEYSDTNDGAACKKVNTGLTCKKAQGRTAPTVQTDTACSECVDGQFSANKDTKACTAWTTSNCDKGHGFVKGKKHYDSSCVTCGTGQYSNVVDDSPCKNKSKRACAVGEEHGYSTNQEDSITCTACAAKSDRSGRDGPRTYYYGVAQECSSKSSSLSGGFCSSNGNDCCAPLHINELATCTNGLTPRRLGTQCEDPRHSAYKDGQYECCALASCVAKDLQKCQPGFGYDEGERGANKDDASCTKCADGQYSKFDNDEKCLKHSISECGEGYGLAKGSTTANDATCRKCNDAPTTRGTYSDVRDASGCKPHTTGVKCNPGMKLRAGTSTSDVECSLCPGGTFIKSSLDSSCTPFTVTKCGLGKGLQAGTAYGDAVCLDCTAEVTFSAVDDATACAPVSVTTCKSGLGYRTGTRSVDAACTECVPGTFSDSDDSAMCRPHSVDTCGPGKGFMDGGTSMDSTCVTCREGMFSDSPPLGDTASCLPWTDLNCNKGQGYRVGSSATDASCRACRPSSGGNWEVPSSVGDTGTYSDSIGKSICQPHPGLTCATGEYPTEPLTTKAQECVTCSPKPQKHICTGARLANGCTSNCPHRYTTTHRCFQKIWGTVNCNFDPKTDPAAHHRNDTQCVYEVPDAADGDGGDSGTNGTRESRLFEVGGACYQAPPAPPTPPSTNGTNNGTIGANSTDGVVDGGGNEPIDKVPASCWRDLILHYEEKVSETVSETASNYSFSSSSSSSSSARIQSSAFNNSLQIKPLEGLFLAIGGGANQRATFIFENSPLCASFATADIAIR